MATPTAATDQRPAHASPSRRRNNAASASTPERAGDDADEAERARLGRHDGVRRAFASRMKSG